MPIPVTCPECQYHFLVGDEFAGRPGRCPECAAIIHVPDADPGVQMTPLPPSGEPRNPPPSPGPRPADVFDEFPSRLRRRRRVEDDVDWDRDQRDDYDDRRRDRSFEDRPRTFDPHARAAKWESVARGLRNLMVAVILMAVAEVVSAAFVLVDGVKPGQQNDFGPREKALIVGNVLFTVITMVLWAMGRVGCGRVPYVPARRIALPAGVIAALTAVCGVAAFGGFTAGILLAFQNQAAAAGLMLLGICAFVPVMFGFPVAELMGLVSQIKMGTGLRDAAFARASRLQLIVALLLTGLAIVGFCVLCVFLMGEMQKAQQKQQQQFQQQQQQPDPKENPAPQAKGKGKARGPGQANNGAAGQQQPPPEVDWGEHPEVVYGVTISRLLFVLIYAAVSVVCFRLGRAAVRREIANLVGDPHDRDLPRDEHY